MISEKVQRKPEQQRRVQIIKEERERGRERWNEDKRKENGEKRSNGLRETHTRKQITGDEKREKSRDQERKQ